MILNSLFAERLALSIIPIAQCVALVGLFVLFGMVMDFLIDRYL